MLAALRETGRHGLRVMRKRGVCTSCKTLSKPAAVHVSSGERARVLVLQPHFHDYRLRARRHPLLQLDEAVALACATTNLQPTGALLVPVRDVAEDTFFTRGKLDMMTELVQKHVASAIQSDNNGSDPALVQSKGSGPLSSDSPTPTPTSTTPTSASPVSCRADAVFINSPALNPRQQLALEKAWGVPVIDRFRVILDIFRARASTKEAKLQVQLAQLPYVRARLANTFHALPGDSFDLLRPDEGHEVGHGHGERQRGGQQTVGGAGETPLEREKRRLAAKEKAIRLELDAIRKRRLEMHKRMHGGCADTHHSHADVGFDPTNPTSNSTSTSSSANSGGGGGGGGGASKGGSLLSSQVTAWHASQRHAGAEGHAHRTKVPVVAVVGYTNAGKTALVRELSGSHDLQPKDMLFATLDTAARQGRLPSGLEAVFVDTVGFVSDLPHQLVEAFKSTLEEVAFADLIVHVTDSTDPDRLDQQVCVLDVLASDLHLDLSFLQHRIQVNSKADLAAPAPATPATAAGGADRGRVEKGADGAPAFSHGRGSDSAAVVDWRANMRQAGVVMMNEAFGYFDAQFHKLTAQLQHDSSGDAAAQVSEHNSMDNAHHHHHHHHHHHAGDGCGGDSGMGDEGDADHSVGSRHGTSVAKRGSFSELISDRDAIAVSVKTGQNVDALRHEIERRLNAVLGRFDYTLAFPVSFGQGTQFVHRAATVHDTDVLTPEHPDFATLSSATSLPQGDTGEEEREQEQWQGRSKGKGAKKTKKKNQQQQQQQQEGRRRGDGAQQEPLMKLCVTLDEAAYHRVVAFFKQASVPIHIAHENYK